MTVIDYLDWMKIIILNENNRFYIRKKLDCIDFIFKNQHKLYLSFLFGHFLKMFIQNINLNIFLI